MKDGILGPKVENVGIAIVQDLNEEGKIEYNAYLLNLRDDIMEGIIITSKGYGENVNTGEKLKTSTLRHTCEVLLPNEAAKIEYVSEEVFCLNNEYWISFWIEDQMYDKKFVFLAETINDKNMKKIPVLGAKGIMII